VDSDRTFLNQFNQLFKRIDEELSRTFITHVPLIGDIGRHSLFGEGKRLRPLLFVLSSRLCGYHGEDIYRLSTMFEYAHTASLLHDDVMDNAETRRSKPSARHVWGNSAAVITGDYLSSLATSIAISTKNMDLIQRCADTATQMTEGQALELSHTDDWNISMGDYMEIITHKTASLMSAACACGAIIAGADKETIDNLSQFGLNLGVVFQLVDDLLDYTSSEEEFGKPVGKDLREGKITLPLIYAISNIEKDELKRLKDLFKNHRASEEDFIKLITLVRNSGAIEKIRPETKDYVDKAAGFLDAFPESTEKEELLALNESMNKRSF